MASLRGVIFYANTPLKTLATQKLTNILEKEVHGGSVLQKISKNIVNVIVEV